MIMDVDFKLMYWQVSIVGFRDEEVGIVTIIQACFKSHPIIKSPSFWFLDFASLATNTYLQYMIHF